MLPFEIMRLCNLRFGPGGGASDVSLQGIVMDPGPLSGGVAVVG